MDCRQQDEPILFLCHSNKNVVNEISRMQWDVRAVSHVTDINDNIKSLMRGVQVGIIEITKDINIDSIEPLFKDYKHVFWIAMINKPHLSDDGLRYLLRNYFYDFHTHPPDFTRLQHMLGHALGMAKICAAEHAQATLITSSDVELANSMLGSSQGMCDLKLQLQKLVLCQLPVLITGESGTGKELVAHELHTISDCTNGPFIAVNCGALSAQLVQSELFGHEKGAFTGATQRKIGKIEAAHNGSLFLDEVGDLPLEEQVNLLRFLQEKTIERVGSHQSIHLNVRIIAATHVDLEAAVEAGRFREDLYFRLNVIRLQIPPLRQRGDDILMLARHFLQQQERPNRLEFSEQAELAMLRHNWSGNVRELLNRVQRASVMVAGRYIQAADLDLEPGPPGPAIVCLKSVREGAEREALEQALSKSQGKISGVAERLNISRATLYRLLDKHSLL